MRSIQLQQLWLTGSSEDVARSRIPLLRELQEMAKILDECGEIPEVYKRVRKDLVGDRRLDCGATGLSAEQALRAAIVQEKLGLTYRELEFHLADSVALRKFVRLEPDKVVKKSVLNRDIRLISEETWKFFNESLKKYALGKHIENGSTIRGDTTAVESNIHHPTDSSLLCDCIRVLSRLMSEASERLGMSLAYVDHNRRAAARLFAIHNAKSGEKRKVHYEDLIKISKMTLQYAQNAVKKLKTYQAKSILDAVLADSIIQQIGHFSELTEKVLSQTIRRVINDEAVPAKEKIVSIFEVHTDIIEKGGRDTTFGHKVYLSSGKSGLILDCEVLQGNPPDHTLAELLLKRHKECYGEAPKKIALDGGFASIEARDVLKKEVEEVAFGKTNGMTIESLTSSSKIFKALRYFRAGIEAGISALKRRYGFTRVLAKGWEAFKASLRCGVCAFNLTLLARHQLKKS